MTFDDVIQDIEKLVGLELQSIRPGASLTILNVDREHSNLLIKTSKGQTKSRPFGELETIWDELNRSPAVHVEGVLHGSGTSRNQPETIFANLPYIEWLRINNKKHIAFVGNVTHAYGTLKQMDPRNACDTMLQYNILHNMYYAISFSIVSPGDRKSLDAAMVACLTSPSLPKTWAVDKLFECLSQNDVKQLYSSIITPPIS